MQACSLGVGGPRTAALGASPAAHDAPASAKLPAAALDPRSAALDPRSAALDPRSAALDPRSAALDPRSAALDPRSAALNAPTVAIDGRATATLLPLLPAPPPLRSLDRAPARATLLGVETVHVTLSGGLSGDYVVEDQHPDGRVVLRPDLSVRAILARHGERELTPEEFERHFGLLPTDGEG